MSKSIIQTILLVAFFSSLSLDGLGQRSRTLQLKRQAYGEETRMGKLSLAGGYALNTNGSTYLLNAEYAGHYLAKVDLTLFHREETYNELELLRSGAMLGVKSTVSAFFDGKSYFNLGIGGSMFHQNPVDFESRTEYQELLIGPYFSAEGFFSLGDRLRLVGRFDQFLLPSEQAASGEGLSFYHVGFMLRYKVGL
ncbi:MAG: hypothetical protein AAGA66_13800 [Bacteroidota bacterium]